MKTKRFFLTCAVLCLTTLPALAQELEVPNTLPRENLRVVVLDFESPDTNYLGGTLARLFAAEMCGNLRDMGGVRARVLRSQNELVSTNEAAPEEIGREEKATLVVWGEYYLEGDTVTVSAHARLTPTPPQTLRDFSLVYKSTEGEIQTQPLTQHVNFKSIYYNRRSLDSLHAMFSAGVTLRASASNDAASTGILKAGTDVTFFSRDAGWVRVKSDESTNGWMALTPALADASERASVPGGFVAGVALFAAGDYRGSENAFTSYLNTGGQSQGYMNHATTRLLLGNARLRAAGHTKTLPKDEAISADFERAALLAPDAAAPAEHLAVARLMRYEGAPDQPRAEALKSSERELIRTLQEDTDSSHVNNLRVFYSFAARRQFLKESGTSSDDYQRELQGRNSILDQVDRYVIVRTRWIPEEYGSIRYGFWTPADEHGVTLKNRAVTTGVENGEITATRFKDVIRHSLDLQVRNKLFPTVFFDVGAGARYIGYTAEGITGDRQSNPTVSSSFWAMIIPLTVGASFSPVHEFPVRPYIMAGIGVALGVSNRKPSFTDGRSDPLESDAKFTMAWNAGVGVDVFAMRRFAISFAFKHENISFKEALYTNQKDLSSSQFQVGLTFVP